MALINCPECGRENVSDKAEMCPNCGYGIKAHFEMIQVEMEQRRLEQVKKLENDRHHQQMQEEAKKEEERKQRELEEMPSPSKPFPWKVILGIFFAALAIVMFCIPSILLGLFETFLAFVLIVGGIEDYKEKKRIYDLSLKDLNRAKREAQAYQQYNEDIASEMNSKIVNAVNPFKEVTNGVKCPMCGKNSGKKISTTSRAASVAMVGLASGKIGKQYKCTSCGHMW